MENLLKRHPISVSRYIINGREECAVSGEFALPDYCPDITVVLKCILTPYVQNRQWSGEQLLVDAMVNVRVLYLDEERHSPRAVEFSIPASCALHSNGRADMCPVDINLTPKYANCRALGPRRIEVRGAVIVEAKAEETCEIELVSAQEGAGLYTKNCTVNVTSPIGMVEKMLTLNEVLEFPETMPPADMLLGGECRAVIRECKLLSGKAIVKGQVYVHQLYTAVSESVDCRCLDFVLPFSQILDMDGVEEGMSCLAKAQILSDTERCVIGPDGENTVLELTVKLLVQLQAYRHSTAELLLDAYHTEYPVTPVAEELCLCARTGHRWENTVLPMKIGLPAGQVSHILDVWIQNKEWDTVSQNGVAVIRGRWYVCVLARDVDGQIVYQEQPEDYCLEFACNGNKADAFVTITEQHYRVIENNLELQVGVCVALQEIHEELHSVLKDLSIHTDQPYPVHKASVLLYYAQAGESVWDIGERCHTSPESICTENELKDEVIRQPMVLMVPVIA